MQAADEAADNTSACPQKFNCSQPLGAGAENFVSFSISPLPSYVSLVSSFLSCLGSLLILLAFLTLPEIRTGAQKLITLLSIADFFTAFGYFIAAINFLTHYDAHPREGENVKCGSFSIVCEVQSFITTTSSLSSFLWTMLLAVYFHMVIVNKQTVLLEKKLFAVFNLVAWGIPLVITIPILATGNLGYSPYGASNWCFIKDTDYTVPSSSTLIITLVFVAGKFWEILSYVVVTVLYISIAISIKRTRKKLARIRDGPTSGQMENVEVRLLAIPVVFLLLRVWGTTQFFYSLSLSSSDIQQSHRCIVPDKQKVFFVLGILQAVGDSGQGWSNAVLYIFLSPTIRQWFICENLSKCYSKLLSFCVYINNPYASVDTDPSTQHSRRSAKTSEMTIVRLCHARAAINRAGDNTYEREAINRTDDVTGTTYEWEAMNRTDDVIGNTYGATDGNSLTFSSDVCHAKEPRDEFEDSRELLDTASHSPTLCRHVHI